MKKHLDKLKSNIKINKNLFVFLLVIVITGIISGSLYTTIVDTNDKQLIAQYLNEFFNNISSNQLNYTNTLINTLVFTIGFAILMWLFGISVIGFFIVIIMLFLKSFILGFSISGIIINFKFKGLLLSIIYIFPHQIINLLIFMLLSAYALIISYKLISSIATKKSLDFKIIINRYLTILIISVFTLSITILYEVYIAPKLLNLIL